MIGMIWRGIVRCAFFCACTCTYALLSGRRIRFNPKSKLTRCEIILNFMIFGEIFCYKIKSITRPELQRLA